MAAVVKIANRDGSGVVSFTGLSTPNPIPQVVYNRVGESETMVAGISGSTIIPGETVHFDHGFSESSGSVEFSFYADQTLKDAVESKARIASPLRFTNDDWTTTWEVVWQPGKSWEPVLQDGFPGPTSGLNAYTCTAKFNVLRRL